jgi:hypothetical protein
MEAVARCPYRATGGYITNRLDFMKTDPVKFLKTVRLGFKKFKILFVKNNKIRKSEW